MGRGRARSKGHDGVVITDYPGGRFLARAWIPDGHGAGKYKNKVHDTRDAAETWARGIRATVTDPDALAPLLVTSVGARLLDDVAHTTADNRRRLARVIDQIASVAPDMRAAGWGLLVQGAEKVLRAKRARQSAATGAQSGTRAKYRNIARLLVRYAMTHDLLHRDPLAYWPVKKQPRPIKVIWTVAEAKALVSDSMRNDPWWLAAVILLYTGQRPSTARALRWSWIDPTHIRIPCSAPGQGKTESEHLCEIEPELRTILDGLPKDGPLVLPKHAAMTGPTFSNGWRSYCDRAGVRSLVTHTARWWNISALIAAGNTLDSVMDRVNHHDSKTTDDYRRAAATISADCRGWGGALRLRGDV